MRFLAVPLAAVGALALSGVEGLPAIADTSPPHTGVEYKRFAELSSYGAARAWYITPGARYVANQNGGDVVIVDGQNGRELGTLSGHPNGIHDGGFSANGRFMATAGNDATVKVWDLQELKEIRSIDAFAAYS